MMIHKLTDINKRPIKIIRCELKDSPMGQYLIMQDDKDRIILTGQRHIVQLYANIPTPFYITD